MYEINVIVIILFMVERLQSFYLVHFRRVVDLVAQVRYNSRSVDVVLHKRVKHLQQGNVNWNSSTRISSLCTISLRPLFSF